jgi:hypothetical protein
VSNEISFDMGVAQAGLIEAGLNFVACLVWLWEDSRLSLKCEF